jgi:hypothetical protein
LASIGLVVSEEKIFEKVYDVRRTPSDAKSSYGLWSGELKKKNWYYINVYTTIKGYLAVA